MLPYHFELSSKEMGVETTNRADYRLYQKFGAEASITFGDVEPIPEDQLKEQALPSPQTGPAAQ